MNTPRVLLLVLIVTAALAGSAVLCSAQTTKPAISEADNVSGEGQTASDDSPAGSGTPATRPAGSDKGPGSLFSSPMIILIGAMLLMFVFMGRGRRKTEAKRKQMLAALKKGDKVTSIGGVVGTIMEVRDDEVTVKVDENNNVRMRFARWAIRGIGETAKDEGPSDK